MTKEKRNALQSSGRSFAVHSRAEPTRRPSTRLEAVRFGGGGATRGDFRVSRSNLNSISIRFRSSVVTSAVYLRNYFLSRLFFFLLYLSLSLSYLCSFAQNVRTSAPIGVRGEVLITLKRSRTTAVSDKYWYFLSVARAALGLLLTMTGQLDIICAIPVERNYDKALGTR